MPKLIASNFFFLIVLFIVNFLALCAILWHHYIHRAEIPNFIFGKNRLEFFNLHREWNSLCCYAASDIIFVQLRHYTERRSSIELAAQVVVVVEVGSPYSLKFQAKRWNRRINSVNNKTSIHHDALKSPL